MAGWAVAVEIECARVSKSMFVAEIIPYPELPVKPAASIPDLFGLDGGNELVVERQAALAVLDAGQPNAVAW